MLEIGTLEISCFYIYSSFNFEFICICYILNHKFSQNVETDTSGKIFSTIVSSMLVNLNQYRGAASVFNNSNIAFCNFCNIWYSQSFQNCSNFICAAFMKSSFLSSLSRVVSRVNFIPVDRLWGAQKVKLLTLTCLFVKRKFNETYNDFSINYPCNNKCEKMIFSY